MATEGLPTLNHGAGLLQGLISVLVVGAPVLIDVVAVFLIMNGMIMLRRESRSAANALPLLVGLALLGIGLAAAYLGFVFVGFLFYSWLYPRLVRSRPARWVVVLGSGLIDGDRVPPLLAGRIAAGQAARDDLFLKHYAWRGILRAHASATDAEAHSRQTGRPPCI